MVTLEAHTKRVAHKGSPYLPSPETASAPQSSNLEIPAITVQSSRLSSVFPKKNPTDQRLVHIPISYFFTFQYQRFRKRNMGPEIS